VQKSKSRGKIFVMCKNRRYRAKAFAPLSAALCRRKLASMEVTRAAL
jgi:hypothetical protein